MDGGTYVGPVDKLKRPHGLGKEYFPPSSRQQRLRYYGHYLNGKKHGNGTLYNVNGGVSYKGKFVYGKPQGNANGENLISSSVTSKNNSRDQNILKKIKKRRINLEKTKE